MEQKHSILVGCAYNPPDVGLFEVVPEQLTVATTESQELLVVQRRVRERMQAWLLKIHGSRETRPKAQFSTSARTPPPSRIKAQMQLLSGGR